MRCLFQLATSAISIYSLRTLFIMISVAAAVFYLLVTLHTTSFVCSQSSCDPSIPKTTTLRLKKDLLCGYDKRLRPVTHHTNVTTVTLIVVPKFMDFEEKSSILKVTSWIGMSWSDAYLKWDPNQYDQINTLILDTKTIWVPDMIVYNSPSVDFTLETVTMPCVVDKTGTVRTVIQSMLLMHCDSDWYNWPYDVHICEMSMDSVSYLGSRVDVDQSTYKKGLYMNYFTRHREWDLLNSNISRRVLKYGGDNDTNAPYDVSLKFSFTFKRHASVYTASYVIPGLVMILMSLCVPWMDTSRSERMTTLCTLVILQSLYLQYIAYKMPSNGDKTPRIVCFYRDSLFMTGLLFIVTIITQQMSSWTLKLVFLQSISNFMATSKPAKFIMLIDNDPKNSAELAEAGEEAVTLVTRDQGAPHQWQMLSLLINRLAFLFVFVIYLFLSLYLLP